MATAARKPGKRSPVERKQQGQKSKNISPRKKKTIRKKAVKKKAAKKKSDAVWCVIGDIRYGSKESEAVLQERAAEILAHPEAFTWGMLAKRKYFHYFDYKVNIFSDDIAHACGCSKRTAQRLLQKARKLLQKPKNGMITIKEFCKLNKLDEKEIRMKIVRENGPFLRDGDF